MFVLKRFQRIVASRNLKLSKWVKDKTYSSTKQIEKNHSIKSKRTSIPNLQISSKHNLTVISKSLFKETLKNKLNKSSKTFDDSINSTFILPTIKNISLSNILLKLNKSTSQLFAKNAVTSTPTLSTTIYNALKYSKTLTTLPNTKSNVSNGDNFVIWQSFTSTIISWNLYIGELANRKSPPLTVCEEIILATVLFIAFSAVILITFGCMFVIKCIFLIIDNIIEYVRNGIQGTNKVSNNRTFRYCGSTIGLKKSCSTSSLTTVRYSDLI